MKYQTESYARIVRWNGDDVPLWFSKPMQSMKGTWMLDVPGYPMDSTDLRELANLLDEMNLQSEMKGTQK